MSKLYAVYYGSVITNLCHHRDNYSSKPKAIYSTMKEAQDRADELNESSKGKYEAKEIMVAGVVHK